ncbi:MAG: hypothetical protein WAU91_09520 [Desulfatitalea sp.]
MLAAEIKDAILKLPASEQKRLVLEIIEALMPVVCTDDVCLNKIRSFVDDATVKNYRDQHMGHI